MINFEKVELNPSYSYYKKAIDRFDQRTKKQDDMEEANTVACGLVNNSLQNIDINAVENSVYVQDVLKRTKFERCEKTVINGIMEGLSPEQISKLNGFKDRQYPCIKARIFRKLYSKIELDRDINLDLNSEDIDLHRILEKFPVSNKLTTYKEDRKLDIEKNGSESVYNLIPEYFPANKTELITKAFESCRKQLKGKDLTKTTLLEINEFKLKQSGIFNSKQQALISKMHGIIYKEKK